MPLKSRMDGATAFVFGTRPEIIKLSPVIRLFQQKKKGFVLVHTGQHYSYSMDQQFFKDLRLPVPDHRFTRDPSIGPNMHDKLVENIRRQVISVFQKEKPRFVLIQGDTDTVLAGAQAASAFEGILIGHVEAGLRSYDNDMPEERNRIAADKLSHILFAPTESAKKNLIKEKLGGKRIEVTGNTIVDALFENAGLAEKKADKKNFQKGYALVTLHRPESVDDKARLENILQALAMVAEKRSLRIIFPIHPRTKQRLDEFGIKFTDSKFKKFTVIDPPLGFLDFIWYEKNADIILTDSGGVQEEACILKVPCVTLRTTTERPETVEAGANAVAGYEPENIVMLAERMQKAPREWKNPFGDGKAAERIVHTLDEPT